MPPRQSKVELYAAIRRDSRAGMSGRALERKYNVSYRTVRAALNSAWPAERKKYPPRASKLDEFKPTIDEWLRTDLNAPRKQRHTVRRIFARLIDEQHMIDVSYETVREYVATRAPQIRAAAGRGPVEVFIPQTHRPGDEAEVDFGELVVELRGEPVKMFLFSFRLSFSGKAIHRISTSGGQEAFFEGHVHAFRVLGGVPFGKVRYDNLNAAVAQVIGLSRLRVETDRWTAFRSHYDLDVFYCQPGEQGAHEKGGVEGDIGWFRRNHLVPVPSVNSVGELNAKIDDWDFADDTRRIGARARTVGEHFEVERPLLKPLPEEDFETGLWFTPRVDRYSLVTVRTNRYSVPVRLIGRQLRVLLHASLLIVYDGRVEVTRHERIAGKAQTRMDLDHYLEGLMRKPGALAGATALEQARLAGKFTAAHDAWWAAARKAHGDRDGTRALIEVLLLHRHMPHAQVIAGLEVALSVGALTADAVALEARKIADATPPPPPAVDLDVPDAEPTIVSSLTTRRLAQLPPDLRPLPSVAIYDQLLRRPYPPREGTTR
ncbi:IS21 family transposase [Nocardia blacklockiae]|uniref:IS21 family transposase n=1 Tax=Nocardia blacklockiae TaxID=480036 RepID=UPI0018934374|nr:IS21 family transposase [Nocardia blacklockiae]MBF6175191.1 IS21 family transposase [Nocardia blacklockiae]